jgi:hypothetical protein
LLTPPGIRYSEKYLEGTPDKTVVTETEELKGTDAWKIPGEPDQVMRINDPEEKDPKKLNLDWLNFNLRGTDAEDFNPNQLIPEAWAMANNQLEPVQAQKFQPRLRTPYDISLQDQLNQTTAKARGAERMAAYNPGMLANLKAQEYMADQNVLGNQFRQNQQFKDQVYSGNLATLNDAQLKNLDIADRQYTRQEQAKSNTKATDFESIKSMSDKMAKHNLENQTLRTWESMHDFRADPSGRFAYRGPNADFSSWNNSMAQSQAPTQKGMDFAGYDAQGNPTYRAKTKSKGSKNTQPWETPGIVSKNGALVKQYKKFK